MYISGCVMDYYCFHLFLILFFYSLHLNFFPSIFLVVFLSFFLPSFSFLLHFKWIRHLYFKLSLGIDFLHHFTEHFCGCKRKKLTVHIMCSTHGRRKVHDYFLLLLCKSSIWFTEKHIFKIIIYFFNTSKCAANYVILFVVYDGLIFKLSRPESWPVSPGWAANVTRIHSWTYCFPWWKPIECFPIFIQIIYSFKSEKFLT